MIRMPHPNSIGNDTPPVADALEIVGRHSCIEELKNENRQLKIKVCRS